VTNGLDSRKPLSRRPYCPSLNSTALDDYSSLVGRSPPSKPTQQLHNFSPHHRRAGPRVVDLYRSLNIQPLLGLQFVAERRYTTEGTGWSRIQRDIRHGLVATPVGLRSFELLPSVEEGDGEVGLRSGGFGNETAGCLHRTSRVHSHRYHRGEEFFCSLSFKTDVVVQEKNYNPPIIRLDCVQTT